MMCPTEKRGKPHNGTRRQCGHAQSARPISARGPGPPGYERNQQGRPKSAGVQEERPCMRSSPGPSSSNQQNNPCQGAYVRPPRKCVHPGQRRQTNNPPRGGVKFADELGRTMETHRSITPPSTASRMERCTSPETTYPIIPGSSNVPYRKLPGVSTIILRPGEINPNETTIIDITGLDENDPVDIGMPRSPIQITPDDEPDYNQSVCRGSKARSRRLSYVPPLSKKMAQATERKSQVCQRTQGYRGRKTEYRDNPLTAEEICEIEESKMRGATWKDEFMKNRDREHRGLGNDDLCDIEEEFPPPLQGQDGERVPSPDPWDNLCPQKMPPQVKGPAFNDFSVAARTTSTPQGKCRCCKQQARRSSGPQGPMRPQASPPRQSFSKPQPQRPRRSPPADPFDPSSCPPRQSSPCLIGADSPEQDLLGMRTSPSRGRSSPGDLMDWNRPAQPPLPFDITCPAEPAATDLLMRSSPGRRLPEPLPPQQSTVFMCQQIQNSVTPRTRVIKVVKCPDDPTMAFVNTSGDSDLGILDLNNMDLGDDSNWLTGPPPQRSPQRSPDLNDSLGILAMEDMDDDLCAPRRGNNFSIMNNGNRPDNFSTTARCRGPARGVPRDFSKLHRRSRIVQEELNRMGPFQNGGGGKIEDEDCPFTDEFATADAEFEDEGMDILGLSRSPYSPVQQRQSPGPYTRELTSALDSPNRYEDLLGHCLSSPDRREQFGPAAQELFNVCAEDATLIDFEAQQPQAHSSPQRGTYSRDLHSNVEWNPQVRDRCDQMYGRTQNR